MKTYIRQIQGTRVTIRYYRGVLASVIVKCTDKVIYDGIKHEIEFYESELNKENWKFQDV